MILPASGVATASRRRADRQREAVRRCSVATGYAAQWPSWRVPNDWPEWRPGRRARPRSASVSRGFRIDQDRRATACATVCADAPKRVCAVRMPTPSRRTATGLGCPNRVVSWSFPRPSRSGGSPMARRRRGTPSGRIDVCFDSVKAFKSRVPSHCHLQHSTYSGQVERYAVTGGASLRHTGTLFALLLNRAALLSLAATPILALKRALVKPDVPAETLRGVVVR